MLKYRKGVSFSFTNIFVYSSLQKEIYIFSEYYRSTTVFKP